MPTTGLAVLYRCYTESCFRISLFDPSSSGLRLVCAIGVREKPKKINRIASSKNLRHCSCTPAHLPSSSLPHTVVVTLPGMYFHIFIPLHVSSHLLLPLPQHSTSPFPLFRQQPVTHSTTTSPAYPKPNYKPSIDPCILSLPLLNPLSKPTTLHSLPKSPLTLPKPPFPPPPLPQQSPSPITSATLRSKPPYLGPHQSPLLLLRQSSSSAIKHSSSRAPTSVPLDAPIQPSTLFPKPRLCVFDRGRRWLPQRLLFFARTRER